MNPLQSLSLAGLVLSLPCALPSQVNLLTNGDFEAGNTNGWTFGGFTRGAQVSKFNTAGVGSTNCFNNRPGGLTTPSPYPPNWMQQSVLQIQGLEYLFTCDLAIWRSVNLANADAGTIEVFADGVRIARKAFGSYVRGTTERDRICVRYKPRSTGQKVLRITFHRRFLTAASRNPTPTTYIDNISLAIGSTPDVCPRGERKLGSRLNLEVNGTPNARFNLYVALSGFPRGARIPGFNGLWQLGPLPLIAVVGKFTATGGFRSVVPIPNTPGLGGTPLFWQAIEASGSTVNIGQMAKFGVY